MSYMRNRHGVVFPRNDALLNDKSLGFEPCAVDGSDLGPKGEIEIPVFALQSAELPEVDGARLGKRKRKEAP